MFKLNGSPINIHADLVIGHGDSAITVPAGSLQDPATRAQYGITEHPDQPRPDDRFYKVTDNGDGTFSTAPKDLDHVKSIRAAEIAASRYALETGGIVLPGNIRISTDRDSQALLSGALLTVQRNPATLIDWKSESGWTQIDKDAVEAIADAVGQHVQSCFSAERVKQEALAALETFEDVIAFQTQVTIPN